MHRRLLPATLVALSFAVPATAQNICQGFGPQTPRDITSIEGTNANLFPLALASTQMNLCNIHTHTSAEHKGPGFSVYAGDGTYGGYKCNETDSLTEAELAMPEGGGSFDKVKPGDTIEVHWVHTSCDVTPGPGLGSCLSDSCANPTLRVETQVFLVVNDDSATNFLDYAYAGNQVDGKHQPLSLPTDTGEPIVFHGSTTGPSYTEETCSPLKVTWSVRPQCAKVSYSSLEAWGADNVFGEKKSHGVRQLVTDPSLLSEIN